jgi:hypothetical protein
MRGGRADLRRTDGKGRGTSLDAPICFPATIYGKQMALMLLILLQIIFD